MIEDKRTRLFAWSRKSKTNEKTYLLFNENLDFNFSMDNSKHSVPFYYDFQSCSKRFDYPFNVLHANSVNEFAHIIIKSLQLPVYLETDITEKLNDFVDKSAADFYDLGLNKLIEDTKSTSTTHDVEDTIKLWERTYKDETLEFSEKKCASDEELFAMAYHKLVHSPVLDTMLKLEHSYANTVRERIKKRDRQELALKDRQTEEMNTAIDNLNITTNEKIINDLVARHFEDLTLLQGKWSSELDTMKEVQRREYRDWIMQMLEENQTNCSITTPSNSPLNSGLTTIFPDCKSSSKHEYPEMPKYEESFTIHLGSQLKQMHNIRIMSSNVMDFCYVNSMNDSSEPTPHLLQTSLALYSNDLCGLVLLTDNHIDSYSKMLKNFTQVCQYSTEFHFLHFDDQLEKIRESAKLNISVMSPQRRESNNSRNKASKNLQTGDIFITRHSNLAQVHVIFHIVTDDTLLSKEINSRHPVLLGLRNILKSACSNDITSITIPLLLQYDMTEEMTVSWCTKRAELVFKCVKGFMIEMASWGGSELKNLQFVLPEGISNEVFQSLTGMLPNIFKVSNPLVLKTTDIQKK